MKVWAIVPALNEATRIAATVAAVQPFVEKVVVVDDGSTDDTAEIAKKAGAIVLRHVVNRGQGAALRTGTEAAIHLGAEAIVHIDADGQHDPSFIPALMEPLKSDIADIVFGSRFMGITATDMPPVRRLLLLHGARAFNALAVGIPRKVTDPQSGIRAMTAASARRLIFRQDRMAHCSEILRLATKGGYRWMEIPVRVHYTSDSLKKGQKSTDALKIVWQILLGTFAD